MIIEISLWCDEYDEINWIIYASSVLPLNHPYNLLRSSTTVTDLEYVEHDPCGETRTRRTTFGEIKESPPYIPV